jgi:hypothetical protein
MKNLLSKSIFALTLFTFLFASLAALAQDDKSKRPSPHKKANGKIGNADVTIEYGSPSVKGRKIFGSLEQYGKVWRTGANEATTFEVSSDVTIEGQDLPAGKYSLFTIPGETEWVIIFNKVANQWGAYSYKDAEDALRVNVKSKKSPNFEEQLVFNVDSKNGKITFAWENTLVEFKVKSKPLAKK